MKRYAIKVLKGKEFIQSKNDIIDLGSKSLETHKKVIDILNTKNPLKNIDKNSIYYLVNEKESCFSLELHKMYKIIYGKNNLRLKATYNI